MYRHTHEHTHTTAELMEELIYVGRLTNMHETGPHYEILDGLVPRIALNTSHPSFLSAGIKGVNHCAWHRYECSGGVFLFLLYLFII